MHAPEIEFVSELPPRVSRDLTESVGAFVAALKSRPLQWGKWPGDARTFSATDVRSVWRRRFGGEFDAEVRNGTLYAQYLGEGKGGRGV